MTIAKCENCGIDIKMSAYKIRDAKRRGIVLCQKCKLAIVMTPEKIAASVAKQRETCISKYGVDSFSKTQEYRQSRSGKNNPMNSESAKQKLKQSLAARTKEEVQKSNLKRKLTCLEKYGHECPLQEEQVLEKTKATNLKLYGAENVSCSEIIKKKKEKTSLEHYGVKCSFQAQEVKEKIKNTLLLKYGTDNVYKISEATRLATCREKYGVDYFFQSEDFFKNRTTKIEYDGYTFDSKDEVDFYKNLKSLNVDFEMQKKYPKPYFVNNKEHWTYVDFYIPEDDLWIEIKGRHFFNENWKPQCLYGSVNDTKNNEKAYQIWQAKLQFLIQENVQILVKVDNIFTQINSIVTPLVESDEGDANEK